MPKRHFTNQLADFVGDKASKHLADRQLIYKEKALDLAALCVRKFPANGQNIDGGLYVGIAGLAYALWYASSKSVLKDNEREYLLKEARRLIDFHLKYVEKTLSGENAGFLLGSSGVFVTGALIYRDMNETKLAEHCLALFNKTVESAVNSSTKSLDYLNHGSDELFVGRAGYLCGILNLERKFQQPVVNQSATTVLVKSIVDSGRRHAKRGGGSTSSPLMYHYYGTEYLGAAHGLAGILQMLCSFPSTFLHDPSISKDVKGAVDWLCSIQLPNGNFPSATDELDNSRSGSDELVHWCHGAPGTVYLLERAYRIWKEERYLKAALHCGELIWRQGLLKKGPGICHGVAGNAYAFLLLHRMTGCRDQRHLHRALQFAEFIDSDEFKNGARTPDTPYSLFEGLAGTLCLFADLASGPEAIDDWEFPLMPVAF